MWEGEKRQGGKDCQVWSHEAMTYDWTIWNDFATHFFKSTPPMGAISGNKGAGICGSGEGENVTSSREGGTVEGGGPPPPPSQTPSAPP